jgi:hypothetical protein
MMKEGIAVNFGHDLDTIWLRRGMVPYASVVLF